MGVNTDVKIDGNEVLNQLGTAWQALQQSHNAAVYNDTGKSVTFDCYRDGDNMRWIAAMTAYCPPHHSTLLNKGTVSKGPTIQVWSQPAGENKMGPFMIEEHKVYKWDGVGFSEMQAK